MFLSQNGAAPLHRVFLPCCGSQCISGVGQFFVPHAVNDATSTIEGTDVISTSFRPPSDMVAMCELVRLFAVGALSTVLLVG